MTKTHNGGGAAELPGLERINALFNWRLRDLPRYPELPLEALQSFSTQLTDAYQKAATHQLQATLAANERLYGLMGKLVSARDAQSLIATEAEIATCLADTGAANAKIWAETTQQIQECCGRFVQDAAVSVKAPTAAAPSANA